MLSLGIYLLFRHVQNMCIKLFFHFLQAMSWFPPNKWMVRYLKDMKSLACEAPEEDGVELLSSLIMSAAATVGRTTTHQAPGWTVLWSKKRSGVDANNKLFTFHSFDKFSIFVQKRRRKKMFRKFDFFDKFCSRFSFRVLLQNLSD